MNRRDTLAGLGAATLLAGCGAGRTGLATDIKVGMSTPADPVGNGVYVWVEAFAKAMRRGGEHIGVYPNSSIGGERERVLQTQMGLLEINVTGGDELTQWSPVAFAGARPFLIDSYAHMDRLLDNTPLLATISRDLAPRGLTVIDQIYTGPMVGLLTKGKAVRTVKDLGSLRLRVLSAADMELLRAWDVAGVQVAWEEVAQALDTGMVDAYLNPPNVAVMFGHGSVLDYFTDLRMGPSTRIIVASRKWLDTLGEAQHALFAHAVKAGHSANRKWLGSAIEADRKKLEKTGIKWIEITPEERESWRRASLRLGHGRWEDPAATAQFDRWVEETRDGPA